MEAARGSLSPRAVWAMRLDEAIHLCAARIALVRRGEAAKEDRKDPGGWKTRPDGSKVKQISSMDELYGFLGS